MIVLHRFTHESPSCSYLPNEQSKIEYELAVQATPQEYEDRMNAGWRKFGGVLFHPTCPTCRATRSGGDPAVIGWQHANVVHSVGP